jgi:hypothetical protein
MSRLGKQVYSVDLQPAQHLAGMAVTCLVAYTE